MLSTQWDSSWPESASHDERLQLIRYLEERFGIPGADFDDCLLFKHRQSWRLLKKSASIPLPGTLKVDMVGMKAFHRVGNFIKPTTRLIQVIGSRATRSRCKMTEKELRTLLREKSMPMLCPGIEDGYVILCLDDYVLGLGLLVRGVLTSQIPRKDVPFYETDRLHA